eukprot:TRINITY_DN7824_c0_g1_i2.p1 TRINITY_DN7824_c0_g1~~TRINITY_DN7824_c0_g1_i2.p1  ORF type:complete len:1020 (-),score=182.51 TRINITY_DN7824_c0_g1_i2:58-3117(-)
MNTTGSIYIESDSCGPWPAARDQSMSRSFHGQRDGRPASRDFRRPLGSFDWRDDRTGSKLAARIESREHISDPLALDGDADEEDWSDDVKWAERWSKAQSQTWAQDGDALLGSSLDIGNDMGLLCSETSGGYDESGVNREGGRSLLNETQALGSLASLLSADQDHWWEEEPVTAEASAQGQADSAQRLPGRWRRAAQAAEALLALDDLSRDRGQRSSSQPSRGSAPASQPRAPPPLNGAGESEASRGTLPPRGSVRTSSASRLRPTEPKSPQRALQTEGASREDFTCSNCGNTDSAHGLFCRHCGHRRPQATERKTSRSRGVQPDDSSSKTSCGFVTTSNSLPDGRLIHSSKEPLASSKAMRAVPEALPQVPVGGPESLPSWSHLLAQASQEAAAVVARAAAAAPPPPSPLREAHPQRQSGSGPRADEDVDEPEAKGEQRLHPPGPSLELPTLLNPVRGTAFSDKAASAEDRCPSCGHAFEADAAFCRHCGKRREAAVDEPRDHQEPRTPAAAVHKDPTFERGEGMGAQAARAAAAASIAAEAARAAAEEAQERDCSLPPQRASEARTGPWADDPLGRWSAARRLRASQVVQEEPVAIGEASQGGSGSWAAQRVFDAEALPKRYSPSFAVDYGQPRQESVPPAHLEEPFEQPRPQRKASRSRSPCSRAASHPQSEAKRESSPSWRTGRVRAAAAQAREAVAAMREALGAAASTAEEACQQCPKCGNSVTADALFCRFCGLKLKESAGNVSSTTASSSQQAAVVHHESGDRSRPQSVPSGMTARARRRASPPRQSEQTLGETPSVQGVTRPGGAAAELEAEAAALRRENTLLRRRLTAMHRAASTTPRNSSLGQRPGLDAVEAPIACEPAVSGSMSEAWPMSLRKHPGSCRDALRTLSTERAARGASSCERRGHSPNSDSGLTVSRRNPSAERAVAASTTSRTASGPGNWHWRPEAQGASLGSRSGRSACCAVPVSAGSAWPPQSLHAPLWPPPPPQAKTSSIKRSSCHRGCASKSRLRV